MGCATAIGRFTTDVQTALAVEAGGNIPLSNSTTTTHGIDSDGYVVTVSAPGTYTVRASLTFAALTAGNVETQLVRDGNAVVGAHAIDTVSAAGDGVSQSLSALITVPRCGSVTLALRAIDATSVVVANLILVRVA